MRKKKKKKWLIAVCIGAAVLLLAGAASLYIQLAPVAWVEGEAVDRRELAIFMESQRAAVITQFRTEYSAVYDENFWYTVYDGLRPIDALREQALTVLKRDKLALIVAKELGIVDSVNYRQFTKSLFEENKHRQEMHAAGGVIYGPIQYSERDYYFHTLENAMLASLDRKSVV